MTKQTKIIEKKFFVLDFDEKNKNHRFYPKDLVEKWIDSEEATKGEGFDVEYALDDTEDIENEYLRSNLSCGLVTKMEIEGTKFHVTVKFKKNQLTEELYSGDIDLDSIAVVPKGKGSVKNQKVQEDYELFGFNLVKLGESSFTPETEEAKEEEVA